MEQVHDTEFEMAVRNILYKMLFFESKSINFIFVSSAPYLMRMESVGNKLWIAINISGKNMLASHDEYLLFCASLAHEIGHVKTEVYSRFLAMINWLLGKNKFNRFIHCIQCLGLMNHYEFKADAYALKILARICANPREILMNQTTRARDKTLSNPEATSLEKFGARRMCYERKIKIWRKKGLLLSQKYATMDVANH